MLFSAPSRTSHRARGLILKPLSRSKHQRALPVDPSISKLPPPRINYKDIVENAQYHKQNLVNRKIPNSNALVKDLCEAYETHGRVWNGVLQARKEQNLMGSKMQAAQTAHERAAARQAATELKGYLEVHEPMAAGVLASLTNLGLRIPNITHPDVPIGPETKANVLSTHGPARQESNAAKDHWKIAKELNLVNFSDGVAVTGAAWYYLHGAAALLEHALVNYALSIAIKHGYTPVSTPDVVKADIARRCGFTPRDTAGPDGESVHHFYHIAESSADLVLAGTAEIPLAGMLAQKTFIERELPRRFVAVGHAFRSEAGSRGAEARGLYRVHQFTKVELFSATEEDKSDAMMDELRQIQVEIFEGLGFPFRVLDMPTEELGHSAYRKYDIEAWMPGRGTWGEISSTSNCLDFQARRLHITYRPVQGTNSDGIAQPPPKSLPFAHTLNGTAAAIPRLIIALIENGIQLNGSAQPVGLMLPSSLRPFWLGDDSLTSYAQITWA